jgi:hypothetical protein
MVLGGETRGSYVDLYVGCSTEFFVQRLGEFPTSLQREFIYFCNKDSNSSKDIYNSIPTWMMRMKTPTVNPTTTTTTTTNTCWDAALVQAELLTGANIKFVSIVPKDYNVQFIGIHCTMAAAKTTVWMENRGRIKRKMPRNDDAAAKWFWYLEAASRRIDCCYIPIMYVFLHLESM